MVVNSCQRAVAAENTWPPPSICALPSMHSPATKRRCIEPGAVLRHDTTLQYANSSPACLRSTLTFFRRFASLIQDSSVPARARAAASLELSDALLAAGASADCDRNAAAIASDWLCSTLNTQLFFTSHASLILQASAGVQWSTSLLAYRLTVPSCRPYVYASCCCPFFPPRPLIRSIALFIAAAATPASS
jgi:hypothetical protein